MMGERMKKDQTLQIYMGTEISPQLQMRTSVRSSLEGADGLQRILGVSIVSEASSLCGRWLRMECVEPSSSLQRHAGRLRGEAEECGLTTPGEMIPVEISGPHHPSNMIKEVVCKPPQSLPGGAG